MRNFVSAALLFLLAGQPQASLPKLYQQQANQSNARYTDANPPKFVGVEIHQGIPVRVYSWRDDGTYNVGLWQKGDESLFGYRVIGARPGYEVIGTYDADYGKQDRNKNGIPDPSVGVIKCAGGRTVFVYSPGMAGVVIHANPTSDCDRLNGDQVFSMVEAAAQKAIEADRVEKEKKASGKK